MRMFPLRYLKCEKNVAKVGEKCERRRLKYTTHPCGSDDDIVSD